ncbi:MAG: methylated-DNA--[protein]-cysteine S-methyltransferase [Pseudomonadota bacterium]
MQRDAQIVGLDSPLGPIRLTSSGGEIVAVDWRSGPSLSSAHGGVLHEAARQLDAYFAGELQEFSLPLGLGPGAFQARFQAALIAIPYGQTRSYGDLAAQLGVSAQAAGQACGANRLPILVPCHRVLAANALGGYSGAGGVETKVALLKLEGAAGLLI